MYCKNCGSQIDDKAIVCPHCGTATDNYVQQPYASAQPVYTAQPQKENVIALIGFILSFVVAIAGLICSIIGYRRAPECNGQYKNLALAGIIISAVELGLTVVFIIFYVIIMVFIFGIFSTVGIIV